MSSFTLKMIAIVSMLIDHVGKAITPMPYTCYWLGRIAFPIFAFQISEGYQHTKSYKNYLKRLLISAIIFQIPYMLFLSIYQKDIWVLNVFFTLAIGLIGIYIYEKSKKDNMIYLGIILILMLLLFAELIKVDYGAFGIGIIILFHVLKQHKWLMFFSYVVICIMKFVPILLNTSFHYVYIIACITTIIPIIFIMNYNGMRGPNTKYIFYLFYPIHLIAIWVLKMLQFL